MNQIYTSNLPSLPLLLWETPPGLDLILAQEGIPCSRVQATHPLAFQRGRFVLYDGRRIAASRVRATLTPTTLRSTSTCCARRIAATLSRRWSIRGPRTSRGR